MQQCWYHLSLVLLVFSVAWWGVVASNERSTTSLRNMKWILTDYAADGEYFEADRHSRMVEEEIPIDATTICSDELLIQVDILGIDAFLRTLLSPHKNKVHGSLHVAVGGTLPAMGVGRVLRAPSESPFQPGDLVSGFLGGQTYCRIPMTQTYLISERISVDDVDVVSYLNEWGPSGMAAYLGMHETRAGPPQPGDAVVVTAAAGATGSMAVQWARICGAKRIVGISRTAKQEWLVTALGVDAAVDYKQPLAAQLIEACPDGIDYIFDNVGGPMLDILLQHLNPHGRVILCGAVSQYNQSPKNDHEGSPTYALQHWLSLAEKSATMTGFNLFHFPPQIMSKARKEIKKCIEDGTLVCHRQLVNGIESFGPALENLFRGGNTGKLLVQVAQDDAQVTRK